MKRTLTLAVLTIFCTAQAHAADSPKPPATSPAAPRVQELRIADTVVFFNLVRIPAGTVTLNRPDKAPETVPVKSLWIGQTELTWDQYDTYALGQEFPKSTDWDAAIAAKTHPSKVYGVLPDYGWGHTDFPVMSITSHAADMYCKWLSQKTGKTFRLPTEAEWEYAARAGDPKAAPDPGILDKIAWYEDNAKNDQDDLTTHKVATKAPNPFALHDMLGNVAEWVAGADGQPVIKGGYFRGSDKLLKYAWRAPYNPKWQDHDPQAPKSTWWLSDAPHVGFRLVMED